MNEKRSGTRQRKRLTLKFGLDGPDRVAFTEDISLHGMFIKTAFVCPPGSQLEIELTLPDGTLAIIKGVVMWAKKVPPNLVNMVKKCGMGVKFTRIESGEEGIKKLFAELHPHGSIQRGSFV